MEIIQNLKPNLCFLHFYGFALGVGTWQTSWALVGNTQTTSIFEAKFEWSKDETKFYNSLISTSGVFGLFVGSMVGGKLISNGRRKAAIYW